MKRRFNVIAISCLLIAINFSYAQDIIPLPVEMIKSSESFTFSDETNIHFENGLETHAVLLSDLLSPATGWDLPVTNSPASENNTIFLALDDNISGEGYELVVTHRQIRITGGSPAGVFYGMQTLRQLLPAEIYNNKRQKSVEWNIQGVQIKDKPEYKWRGMMLDVSRYFFDKDYVKKYIDMMSMYKLNTLHLHLIDDAGWRLEIKKYPKLTAVGAWRGEGIARSGGYYTHEDIREMVEYATLRNVDIIPEIEVPAHTLAAIAAYPYLSCTEKPVKVQDQHSISRELYCVGKETTFEFLENVFEEAADLFPSKYIHIGGDEARYDRWKTCEHCQKRKKELGIKDEAELQVYFNRRMQSMAKNNGKTIVGWDEIIEEGLEDKVVGMIWHNKEKAIDASRMGHDIVLTLTDHCYFDFPESSLPGEVKAATWMPPISLEKVYSFNPVIEGLGEQYKPQILGGQGALWSDQFIHGTILQEIAPINENRSEAYFDYLTFPRMSALAEVLWTQTSDQNWEGFEQRMQTHYGRYDQAEYGYRVPQPKLISKEKTDSGYLIELENVVEGAEIRFTTNGLKPNVYSEFYSKPIFVNRLQDFQAITVVNRHHYSIPLIFPVTYPQFEEFGILMAEWRAIDVVADQSIELERKITGLIKKNGSYAIAFLHTDGDDALEIQGITVYKNRKIFADDIHIGKSHIKNDKNIFSFQVDNYETGAEYSIKAKIVGLGGDDSNGVIFIKMTDK